MTKYNSVKVCKRAIIVALAALPLMATAAVNGSTGSTSSGSVNVFINVGSEVRISGLQDYRHPSWDGNPYEFTRNFCVYSNNPDNKYTVTVTGTNNENKFKLVNEKDPDNSIDYEVQYQDANTTSYYAAPAGARLVDMVGSGSTNCNGGTNAQMKINVGGANGLSGTYAGTVNVTVMPQ